MNRPLLSCGIELDQVRPEHRARAEQLRARCDRAAEHLAGLAAELAAAELELDVAPVSNAAAVLGAYGAALGFLTTREGAPA